MRCFVGLLSAEQVLSSSVPFEDVPCPEWGGEVRIQGFTAAQRAEFNDFYYNEKGKLKDEYTPDSFWVHHVIWHAVDESGSRLFSIEQAGELVNKADGPLSRLYAAVRRVDGQDLNELAKN